MDKIYIIKCIDEPNGDKYAFTSLARAKAWIQLAIEDDEEIEFKDDYTFVVRNVDDDSTMNYEIDVAEMIR